MKVDARVLASLYVFLDSNERTNEIFLLIEATERKGHCGYSKGRINEAWLRDANISWVKAMKATSELHLDRVALLEAWMVLARIHRENNCRILSLPLSLSLSHASA